MESTRELLGVDPDVSCYAKLLTGGLVPMSATIATERVFDAFSGAKVFIQRCHDSREMTYLSIAVLCLPCYSGGDVLIFPLLLCECAGGEFCNGVILMFILKPLSLDIEIPFFLL